MDIFIVEDDLFKFSKIESVIFATLGLRDCLRVDNVHDAVGHIRKFSPDKLVLDMSLPSHAAKAGQGSPISMPNGGLEVILEIRSENKAHIDTLILTQYPVVEIEYEYYSIEASQVLIKELYGMENLKVVHYDEESTLWADALQQFLEN